MATKYQLDIPAPVQRQLRRVMPDSIREEVIEVVLTLQYEPYPDGSDLQDNLSHRRRIRVGGWRIIYKVDESDAKVTILAIRPRNRNTYINVP
jgi:mRNA interferase RelE/StbE